MNVSSPSLIQIESYFMETRIAKFLSYILHPLLIPAYLAVFLLNTPLFLTFSLSSQAKAGLIGVIAGFTFVLPAAAMLAMRYFKMVSTLQLEIAEERTLPLIITSASYMALLYLLRRIGLPAFFLFFFYGAVVTLVAGLLINLAYKISLHTLAWGSVTAALAGFSIRMGVDFPLVILGAILLAGTAGFARLKLQAHSPAQVYLGFLAGAGIMLLLTFLL